MSEQIATLGEVDIAFNVFGDARNPAIVLVRGLGTQLIDWPDQLVEGLVNGGLRVVVFDNRDTGLSQKFSGKPNLAAIASGQETPPYTLSDMADDIVSLLDHLDIRQASLFGISMGGMIGQVAVARHGNRFGALFSVMSSSGKPGLPGPTPAASAALQGETDPDASREDIIRAAVHGLQVCGSPGYPVSEEMLTARVRRRYERCYCPDGVSRQMAAIVAGGDRSSLLQSIRTPTHVIHGENDPLIPVAAGEDTAAQIPGASFQTIAGMGHDLPDELVPLLVISVLEFLRS